MRQNANNKFSCFQIGKIYEAKYDYRDKSQGSAFGKNHNGYRSLKNRINGICTGKDDLVRSLFSRFLVKLHGKLLRLSLCNLNKRFRICYKFFIH